MSNASTSSTPSAPASAACPYSLCQCAADARALSSTAERLSIRAKECCTDHLGHQVGILQKKLETLGRYAAHWSGLCNANDDGFECVSDSCAAGLVYCQKIESHLAKRTPTQKIEDIDFESRLPVPCRLSTWPRATTALTAGSSKTAPTNRRSRMDDCSLDYLSGWESVFSADNDLLQCSYSAPG
jgi:hypothetical protein